MLDLREPMSATWPSGACLPDERLHHQLCDICENPEAWSLAAYVERNASQDL